MKKCPIKNSIEIKNDNNCIVFEFPMEDKDMNFSIAKITGRYPEHGRVTNIQCKEIVYVQAGAGKIVVDDIEHALSVGDVILISPNERFYWDGNMTIHVACTPAFFPEQHVYVE